MTSESTNCPSGYHHGSNGCYRDHWYIWVWGVLGTLAVLFLAAISFCTFLARRRRSRGLNPFYGTGWLTPQKRTSRGGNGGSVEMNNQQRRRQADPEGEDNPPPAYDQQRLPPYTNTSMASDSHHGNSEDLQGDSQKHEDHH